MSVWRPEWLRAVALWLLPCSVLAADAAVDTGLPIKREPITPIPVDQELPPRLVELGRKLFFDPAFAGEQGKRCADCHALPAIREGAAPVEEVKAKRSVPLLYDTGELFWYDWDGRFENLETLVDVAIEDPDKMNTEWSSAMGRLEAGYSSAFQQLNKRPMARQDVVAAVAAFLQSLNAPNARFDRYLRGEKTVLSDEEREGYRLFKKVGCVRCHNGRMLGGNFFESVYLYRHEDGHEAAPRMKDLGRYLVTGDEQDRNLFRVPSLRNVALTAPYFHDRSIATLDDAIEEMGEHQLGVLLTEEEIASIKTFLLTLTGTHPGVEP